VASCIGGVLVRDEIVDHVGDHHASARRPIDVQEIVLGRAPIDADIADEIRDVVLRIAGVVVPAIEVLDIDRGRVLPRAQGKDRVRALIAHAKLARFGQGASLGIDAGDIQHRDLIDPDLDIAGGIVDLRFDLEVMVIASRDARIGAAQEGRGGERSSVHVGGPIGDHRAIGAEDDGAMGDVGRVSDIADEVGGLTVHGALEVGKRAGRDPEAHPCDLARASEGAPRLPLILRGADASVFPAEVLGSRRWIVGR
jgi:hypothetical protein